MTNKQQEQRHNDKNKTDRKQIATDDTMRRSVKELTLTEIYLAMCTYSITMLRDAHLLMIDCHLLVVRPPIHKKIVPHKLLSFFVQKLLFVRKLFSKNAKLWAKTTL